MKYQMQCQNCGHSWTNKYKQSRCISCCGNDVKSKSIETSFEKKPVHRPESDQPQNNLETFEE